MIDHAGIPVSDFNRSKDFYQRTLLPLGIGVVMEVTSEEAGGSAAGFGANGKPFFWIGGRERQAACLHIAFRANSRAEVDAFHRAGLSAGGTDNGAPGLRPHYHPNYYGAFIIDPNGNNIEAVCHKPE